LAALALLPALARPAPAADAVHGEQLARRWCASCHIVASDQTRGADNAPPFATIAKRPGFDADKIARFLMNPHPKMPDMHLSRNEARDLGAYIASLAQ
jgi:mono/diheme cytochrome c family protein